MNALIIKVLAVGLTLSQLLNGHPDKFREHFDPQTEQAKVEELLTNGCEYLIKEFKADDVPFDMLFNTMISSLAKAKEKNKPVEEEIGAEVQVTKTATERLLDQLNLPVMHEVYKKYCKKEKVDKFPVNIADVIEYYNAAVADLPDHTILKTLKLKEASILLDQKEEKFTEVYSEHNRRKVVSIKDLPPHVIQAFIAAEDQDFRKHPGIDIHGVIRAFSSIAMKGKMQGGSTITQQVVKNLLTGDDWTFERKIKEMILATRVERLYPNKDDAKDRILELYINYVFLGRASWGIEMAAKNYFNKSAKNLTVSEAAFLAGLTRGPNWYHPGRNFNRAMNRRAQVLDRMKDDGYLTDEVYDKAGNEKLQLAEYQPPRTLGGFYFIDEINRQVKKLLNGASLTSESLIVYSTMHAQLQKAADEALRKGLMAYEADSGRTSSNQAVQGNIAKEIAQFKTNWRDTLPKVRPRLFDLPWTLAVVTQTPGKLTQTDKKGRKSTTIVGAKVGLEDGRQISLSASEKALNSLKLYDLVFVNITEGKKEARATIKMPPSVQGAVAVLENKTGKVLAMTGGFSYGQSQLNRVTQTARQPGSTLKPFIYLSALALKYQPNTLIPDEPVEFPPIARGGDFWTPKNYDGGSHGLVTMRQAIEKSLNLPTARMMAALGESPAEGLDWVRGITQELGIYKTTERFFPFVLGAQPARLIDMATAYATVANLGERPTPQYIDKIVRDGRIIFQRTMFDRYPLRNADRVSFYQLRRILEGTLVRGTATKIKDMVGAVAGKTGTSNDENDAWFVGFTNDITVAVWVGYDSRRVRSNLGGRFTGGRVALPIAESVFRESFKVYKPMEAFYPPPADIKSQIVELPIDVETGETDQGNFVEVFRLEKPGGPRNKRRTELLTPEQIANPNFSFPYGEEENANQLAHIDDDLNRRMSPLEEVTPKNERYNPGYEDIYDRWNQGKGRRRQDPGFFTPLLLNQREQ